MKYIKKMLRICSQLDTFSSDNIEVDSAALHILHLFGTSFHYATLIKDLASFPLYSSQLHVLTVTSQLYQSSIDQIVLLTITTICTYNNGGMQSVRLSLRDDIHGTYMAVPNTAIDRKGFLIFCSFLVFCSCVYQYRPKPPRTCVEKSHIFIWIAIRSTTRVVPKSRL